MTVTRFAHASRDAALAATTKLPVHGSSTRAAVDACARVVALLPSKKWHPHKAANFSMRVFSPGKVGIFIKSDTLDVFSMTCAALRMHNPIPPGGFHVTIGDADPNEIMKMLLDKHTTYTIGVAVRATDADVPTGLNHATQLYP